MFCRASAIATLAVLSMLSGWNVAAAHYHDVTYMPVDRAEMNRKMFAALKPGGFLVIADHSARPGDGSPVTPVDEFVSKYQKPL